jgi:hypothetical protein
MARVLHRVQVVQITEEFVEAVQGWQELVQVAQVVFAELAGGVAHGLEHGGDCRRLVGHSERAAGLANGSEASADRQFTGDEVRATRRTARLCVGGMEERWVSARDCSDSGA